MCRPGTYDWSVTLRLSLACDLAAVRPSALAVREFLEGQGVAENEVEASELTLVEACNNAVQYATEMGRQAPVEILVLCSQRSVELRVTDHTPGFEWPEQAELPATQSERGRGVFLIQYLMDKAEYSRGVSENTLVMVKRRSPSVAVLAEPKVEVTTLVEANRLLAESQLAVDDLAAELRLRSESLSAILRCSSELGRTHNPQVFSHRLLTELLRIVNAEWFVLRLLHADSPTLEVFAASEPALLKPLRLSVHDDSARSVELAATITRKDIVFDGRQPLDRRDPLSVARPGAHGLVRPLLFGDALVGTLAVGRGTNQPPLTVAQKEVVHTFAEYLAIPIVHARLDEELVSNRLLAREMEIAHNIQRSLLPKSLPQPCGFSLAGFCESARQIGGDFYDVVPLSDTSVLLVVADVMGKGVPAAMFALNVRSRFHSMLPWANEPAEMLSRLNQTMFGQLSDVEMFLTAQVTLIDTEKRQLVVASAGHCPALLATGNGNKVRVISPEGMPFGILPKVEFNQETVRLGENSRMLLYTDGLSDAENPCGESFGQNRLMNWLSETVGSSCNAEQLKQDLVAEFGRFQSGAPPEDDQTFLILAETDNDNGSNPHFPNA